MLEAFPGAHFDSAARQDPPHPREDLSGPRWFSQRMQTARENSLWGCSLELLSFYQVDVSAGHILRRSFPAYDSVLRTLHASCVHQF